MCQLTQGLSAKSHYSIEREWTRLEHHIFIARLHLHSSLENTTTDHMTTMTFRHHASVETGWYFSRQGQGEMC